MRRLLAGLLLAGLLPGVASAASPDTTPDASHRGVRQPAPAARDTGSLRIPDVPFVSQTEALCGGASVAMALRYWGERGVHAGDFRHLVTGRPAGITTSDLMGAVRDRGWIARRIPGSTDALAEQLETGRPAVALIRVSPGRYHYVVVLAVTPSRVLYHDPARGPYRVMEREAWSESWRAAERWAAVVLPGDGTSGARLSGEPDAGAGDSATAAGRDSAGRDVAAGDGGGGAPGSRTSDLPPPCGSLLRDGVRRARAGDVRAGAEALRAASELCPDRPEPWSELAGVRFRQEEYGEAARLAERAARLSGGDPYPWRLLGTARYLSGDRRGALRAWNRIGAPAVDHVRIQGLRRIRHRPALDLLGLSPGSTLTPGRLLRGRRRLSEVPALRRARVDYRALEGDRAEVRVAAWERRPPTASLPRAAAVAVRALADRTLRVSWPGPTGGGEVLSAAWRWTPGRPAVSAAVRAPGPGGAVAVWGAEGDWERQSYLAAAAPGSPGPDPDPGEGLEEERRRAALSAADWITGRLRVGASAGLDRWSGGRIGQGEHSYLQTGLGAAWRTAGGAWTVRSRGAAWIPLAEGRPSFRSVALGVRGQLGQLGQQGRGVTASLRGGFRRVTGTSPLALWPGAGTGRGRDPLLRAHPLLEGGRIAGPAFGRSLVHGGAETTAWLGGLGPLRAGLAGFVDGALAADRADGWPGEGAHVDAGTGLRLRVGPGGGTLRLDAAVGLRDGRTALSVGWASSGGRRARR